jgi:hypothetical protein
MFAEGLVPPSVTFVTVVNQRTHVQKSAQMRHRWPHTSPKMCIVRRHAYFVIMSLSRSKPRRTLPPMFYRIMVAS